MILPRLAARPCSALLSVRVLCSRRRPAPASSPWPSSAPPTPRASRLSPRARCGATTTCGRGGCCRSRARPRVRRSWLDDGIGRASAPSPTPGSLGASTASPRRSGCSPASVARADRPSSSPAATTSARSTAPIAWPSTWACGSTCTATWSPTSRGRLAAAASSTSAARPLFAIRGIQPFHDFPEGPDWWNGDDYKAILGQLPKLRHELLRPAHLSGGRPERRADRLDRAARGRSARAARSRSATRRATSRRLRGNWGYAAKKTSDYAFGAGSCSTATITAPTSWRTSLHRPERRRLQRGVRPHGRLVLHGTPSRSPGGWASRPASAPRRR